MPNRDEITADIIGMYDNAIRAADVKAQIILVFVTLFMTPVLRMGQIFNFASWVYVIIVLEYSLAALFFIISIYPRTSLPGRTGYFSTVLATPKPQNMEPSEVQSEMLEQKHRIYFSKLKYIRFGIWACVLQIFTFCVSILHSIGK